MRFGSLKGSAAIAGRLQKIQLGDYRISGWEVADFLTGALRGWPRPITSRWRSTPAVTASFSPCADGSTGCLKTRRARPGMAGRSMAGLRRRPGRRSAPPSPCSASSPRRDLNATCSGVADQLGDDLARLPAALRREFVKQRGVLAADPDHARQLGPRGACMGLDEAAITRVDRRQELIEVPGLARYPDRRAAAPRPASLLAGRRAAACRGAGRWPRPILSSTSPAPQWSPRARASS